MIRIVYRKKNYIITINNTFKKDTSKFLIYPATGSPTATMLRLNPNYQQDSIKYYHI